MTRPRRLFVLTAANCLFWIASGYVAWNRLIPERLIPAAAFVSMIFAVPLGLCSLPFLVVSELHDTGWRIAVYGSLTLANSVAWAWLVDRLWTKLAGRASPRGFPVGKPGDGGSAAE